MKPASEWADELWDACRGVAKATALPFIVKVLEQYAEERVREAQLFERSEAGMVVNWEHGFSNGRVEGYEAGIEEAIEWCMAFRRDDGTAQKIEEKLRLSNKGA